MGISSRCAAFGLVASVLFRPAVGSISEAAEESALAQAAGESIAAAVAGRNAATLERLARLAEMAETVAAPDPVVALWLAKETQALAPGAALAWTLDARGAVGAIEPASRAPLPEPLRVAAAALAGAQATPSWRLVLDAPATPHLLFVAPRHAAATSGTAAPAAGEASGTRRVFAGALALASPVEEALAATLSPPGLRGRAFVYDATGVRWSASHGDVALPSADDAAVLARTLPLRAPAVLSLGAATALLVPGGASDWAFGIVLAADLRSVPAGRGVPWAAPAAVLALLAAAGAYAIGRRRRATDAAPGAGAALAERVRRAEASAVEAKDEAASLGGRLHDAEKSLAGAAAERVALAEKASVDSQAVQQMRLAAEEAARSAEQARFRVVELERSLSSVPAGDDAVTGASLEKQLDDARLAAERSESDRERLKRELESERARAEELRRRLSEAEASVPSASRPVSEAAALDAAGSGGEGAGRPTSAIVPDVKAFLLSVWQAQVPEFQKRLLRYPTRVSDGIPPLALDDGPVRDMLVSLVSELAGQTPEGGLIELSAKWQAGVLELGLRHTLPPQETSRGDAVGADLGIPDEPMDAVAAAAGARLAVERIGGRHAVYRMTLSAPARLR